MPNHLPFLKSFTLQGEFIQSDTSMLTIKTHKVFHFHFQVVYFPNPSPNSNLKLLSPPHGLLCVIPLK